MQEHININNVDMEVVAQSENSDGRYHILHYYVFRQNEIVYNCQFSARSFPSTKKSFKCLEFNVYTFQDDLFCIMLRF